MKTSIKSAIGRVTAGEGARARIGTTFLVAKRYALTALHVVGDRESIINGVQAFLDPITIRFEGAQQVSLAHVVDGRWDATDDWALLELDEDFESAEPLQLAILPDGVKAEFEAFGYPHDHGSLTVGGVVRDTNATYFDATAMQLFAEEAAAGQGDPLNGLSGAPCIVGNYAIGLVRAHPVKKTEVNFGTTYTIRNGVLYACSPARLLVRCNGLLPPPTQLSFEAFHRLTASEARLASLKHYKRAVKRLCSSLPYHLPGGGIANIESSYVDLNGSISQGGGDPPVIGPTTRLVANALTRKNVVTLIAPPGAGKTSLLQFWGRVLWDEPQRAGFEAARLVVMCRFRDLARSKGGTVSERMRNAIGAIPELALGGTGIPDDFLVSWPEGTKTRLLFLFDGFDELPHEVRNDVAVWLHALVGEFPDADFVMTSRDEAIFENTPFALQRQCSTYIDMEPPTLDQAVVIASGFLAQNADHLIARVKEARVEDILTTPLGIALAAAVYRHDGVVPEARATLYDRYIEISLTNAIRQGMKEQAQLDASNVRFLMERLAWAATEKGHLSESEAQHVLAEGLRQLVPTMASAFADSQSGTVWEVLKERSGIMTNGAEWVHQTFREFLAARYLIKALKPDSDQMIELVKRQADPRFRGVLLFIFNMWSTQSHRSSESELDTYRRVFEQLIGKTVVQDYPLRKFIRWFHSFIGTRSNIQEPSEDSSSPPDLLFAAEVLLELGKAPRDVEERILELLFQNGRKAIENTFINPCASVFSSRGCPEKGLLRRWCRQPRLNTRLDIWAEGWKQDLMAGSDEPVGPAGLLVLCERNDDLLELLQQNINGKTCVGILKALKWANEGTKVTDYQRSVLRKLGNAVVGRRENSGAVAFIAGINNDASSLLPKDPKLVQTHFFYRRVAAWMAAVSVSNAHNPSSKVYLTKFEEAAASTLDPEEARQVFAAASKSKTIWSPVMVALESLLPEDVERLAGDNSIPFKFRRFVEWYQSHLKDHSINAMDNPLLKYMTDVILESGHEEGDLRLAIEWLPTELLIEELARPELSEELAREIVNGMKAACHASALENFGVSGKGTKAARIAALEQAHEHEPSERLETQILSLEKNHLPTLRKRAERLENADDFDAAEKELDGILQLSPDDYSALESRARIKLNTDRKEPALVDITAALKGKDALEYRWYLRGRILQEQEHWRDAIVSFDAAQNAGNNQYRLYQQRANSYFSLGLLNEAIKDADTILTDDASHVDARMLKAVCLSSLGRWTESEALLKGDEGTLSKHNRWIMTRLQNMLGTQKTNDAYDFLASLGEGYELCSLWEESMAMFCEKIVTGKLSDARLQKMKEAVRKDQGGLIHFWLLVATEDLSGSKDIIAQLIKAKREDDLRWISIDGKATLKAFLPPWVDFLIDRANAAAASISIEVTAAAIQKQKKLVESLTGEKGALENCTAQKKVKHLIENGMLCKLHNIVTYEEELEMAKRILESHNRNRTMVIMPLLDTGHIYIQANVKWNDSDPHNFKLVGPYVKFRDSGKLVSIVKDNRIQKVIVTEQGLYQRMDSHPSLRPLHKVLELEKHSLPYTGSEVEFK